ncbi:arrestin domain-containing protein 17-like [Liolophura sinensis]|uniref:arrestin domain-containing protein 17-like n=1 Tax=Liolophura sinensis TaxID=3198878 RepID=UPI00315927EF
MYFAFFSSASAASIEEVITLKEGPHSFDFQFNIPDSSPPSFEGKFGWVRYSLECRIEKPWKSDYLLKDNFQVMNHLDLNLEKEAEEPYHKEVKRADACCFCYDNVDVSVCLDLPRRGFVPGEYIPVTAEIKNNTSEFVTTSVHFIKKVTYTSPEADRTKVSKHVVNQIPDFELEPHNKYVFNREKIEVPSIPASCLLGCNLITVSYYLMVKACTEYSGVRCKVVADLIIGTEPLASHSRRTSQTAPKDEMPAPLARPEWDRHPDT